MAIRLDDYTLNSGDWSVHFTFDASYDGGQTYGEIDFTGCFIRLQVHDQNNCLKIDASTTNGKITILDAGFDLLVPYDEMKCICAGQYKFGTAYQKNGATTALSHGTLTVADGDVRL